MPTIDASQLKELSEEVKKGMATLSPPKVAEAVGRQVANDMRNHLFQMDRERPNQLGGRRTHWYAKAAKGTTFTSGENFADVDVAQIGINQRIYGGKIEAGKGPHAAPSSATGKPAQYLSIPAIAQAHGRRPSEFGNLRFVRFGKAKDAVAALVEKGPGATNSATGKRIPGRRAFSKLTGYRARVFYWLKRVVFQKPDPSIVLNEQQTAFSIDKAISLLLAKFKL